MDARFNIYSGLLKAYTSADGKKHLQTTASSTVRDLAGDEIRLPAIEKMAQSAVGMTIFLNHEYKVPEDVLGTVENTKVEQRGWGETDPIVDLDFDVVVNETNPRALKTWEAVDSGVKLGTSIGAQIPKGGATKKKDGGFIIEDVNLLEASIVGIPANPRSWVQYATKSLSTIVDGEEPSFETEPEPEPEPVPTEVEKDTEPDTTGAISEELAEDVQPDLAEGRTRVTVTVTSDDSQGSQTTSPGASENDALLDETAEGDTEDLGDTVTRDAESQDDLHKAFETTSGRLVEVLTKMVELQKQVEDLNEENGNLKENLKAAKDIIDRIADLPIGRKATFSGAVTDFRQRFPMYDEEFVKLLER